MNNDSDFKLELFVYALEFIGGVLIVLSALSYTSYKQDNVVGCAEVGKSIDTEESALESHVGDESVDAKNSLGTNTTVGTKTTVITTKIKQTNMDINESSDVKARIPDEAELYPEEKLDSEETTETKGWNVDTGVGQNDTDF